MFFSRNAQMQTKDKKHHYATYKIETPEDFTIRKAAIFGLLSLMVVSMVHAPTGLDSNYAYGANETERRTILVEDSWGRNHFTVDFTNNFNSHNDPEAFLVDERTIKNHFSYEYANSDTKFEPLTIVSHGQRR